MIISEIKAEARKTLEGLWWKAALLILVFVLASFVLGLIQRIPVLGALISMVLSVPLSYGLLSAFIKLRKDRVVAYDSIFKDAFSNFGRAWFVSLHTLLKVLPWVLLLIAGIAVFVFSMFSKSLLTVGVLVYLATLVVFVVKVYGYVAATYIAIDRPDLTPKQAVEESSIVMEGNKWKFFCLSLSFIGWAILAALTVFLLGIGYLFLLPYIQVSMVIFYESLGGKPETSTVNTNPEPVENPVSTEDTNPIQEN